VTQPGHQAIFTCTGTSSVTDNFGNLDNLRARERRSKRKCGRSLILSGRRDTQAVTITSVTEVIEVSKVTSFGVGCSGRISQGASESTAASSQRTCKYDGY
jgi:hypothetical protein